ncbi:hypothetical protein Pan44_26380 [Caulifigura coniformis]|uniref:Uncharacterized protein n=1 Tax=Caulifigura coniformis TaxID=2527983 RepID=A0A517SEQ2_9PLAN|nr:hypothetical protein [Caulifigura coniformis]QDT54604.1 hypothetical protein Pan44_26380 [Caulifigura coniformis]
MSGDSRLMRFVCLAMDGARPDATERQKGARALAIAIAAWTPTLTKEEAEGASLLVIEAMVRPQECRDLLGLPAGE